LLGVEAMFPKALAGVLPVFPDSNQSRFVASQTVAAQHV
jgi:hypothetical protein